MKFGRSPKRESNRFPAISHQLDIYKWPQFTVLKSKVKAPGELERPIGKAYFYFFGRKANNFEHPLFFCLLPLSSFSIPPPWEAAEGPARALAR